MKLRLSYIYLITALIFVIFLFITILINHNWGDVVWKNELFHVSITTTWVLIALLISSLMFGQSWRKQAENIFPAALGIMSIGLLEAFHTFSYYPEDTDLFVFLHTLSNLSGGFFFVMIWLPGDAKQIIYRYKQAIILLSVSVLSITAVWSILDVHFIREMNPELKFTDTAVILNMFAAALFLISMPRVLAYYRESEENIYLLITFFALFTGTSAFSLQFSSIWSPSWWFWHLQRMIAYIIVISLFLIEYRKTIVSLKNYKDHLEEIVKKRTFDLNNTNILLRDSEEKYRNLIQTSRDWIWELNIDCVHTFSNQAVEEILGYKPEEIIGTRLDLLHEEDQKMVQSLWFQWIEKRSGWNSLILRWRHKNGEYKNLESNAVPVFDVNGKMKGFRGIDRDITGRKRAEAILRESEERFKALTESTSDWIWEVDENAVYTYTSPKIKDILGYAPGEVIGKTPFDLMPPEEARNVAEKFNVIVKERRPFAGLENVNLHKNGRLVTLETSGVPIFNAEGYFKGYRGIDRDITARKRSEKALFESEKKYRDMFESATDAIFILDLEGNFIDINTIAYTRLGYTKEEMLAMHISRLDPPEFAARVPERLAQINEQGRAVFESAHVKRDGSMMPVEVNARLYEYEGKKAYLSFVRDITERKTVEEMLRKNEGRLNESQKVARIGSWNWDVINNTLEWSDETYRRFDKDPATFTPTVEYFVNLIHPEDRETIRRAIQDTLENDKPYHIQPRIINESGREWVLEGFGIVSRYPDGKPLRFAGTAQDITERKKIEDQVRASLKEKEILLQEIHHRVKNNMTVIQSLLQLQSRYIDNEHYREILNESMRRIKAMALVHEKLYKSDDLANIDFDKYLSDLINSISQTYSRASHRVSLKTSFDNIHLDIDTAIPCGLIVNELITNALKYAFPENREGQIEVSLRMNGNKTVQLMVRDDGIGLPDELEIGNTRTLGFDLVYALVNQLQGKIQVTRQQGAGFSITFRKRK